MLWVPRRRQPDRVSCLPTCVWAVLEFEGQDVTFDEVVAACLLGSHGAVLELALQGLREADWDVQVVDDFDLELIQEALDEGRPLITTIRSADREPMAHAVVVCAIGRQDVIVMDPLVGEYVSVPLADFNRSYGHRFSGGFFIAGRSGDGLPRSRY